MEKERLLLELQAKIDALSNAGAKGNSKAAKAQREAYLADEADDGCGQRCEHLMGFDDRDERRRYSYHPDVNSKASAFKKIVDLINASEKSEHDIRKRLHEKGFAQSDIDESVQRAKDCGYLDDERFASVLVRSRLAQGRGCAGIVRELESHEIDPYSLPGWPEELGINPNSELERALSFLERRPPKAKNKRQAAYRRLIAKGYESSIASSASRMYCEQCEDELFH